MSLEGNGPKTPTEEERKKWREEHINKGPGKTFVQTGDGSLMEAGSTVEQKSDGESLIKPKMNDEQMEEYKNSKRD